MPSTMFSVKGSKGLSVLRMNSGFRRYPQRRLYSNIPIFSCIARSAGKTHTTCKCRGYNTQSQYSSGTRSHFLLLEADLLVSGYRAKKVLCIHSRQVPTGWQHRAILFSNFLYSSSQHNGVPAIFWSFHLWAAMLMPKMAISKIWQKMLWLELSLVTTATGNLAETKI